MSKRAFLLLVGGLLIATFSGLAAEEDPCAPPLADLVGVPDPECVQRHDEIDPLTVAIPIDETSGPILLDGCFDNGLVHPTTEAADRKVLTVDGVSYAFCHAGTLTTLEFFGPTGSGNFGHFKDALVDRAVRRGSPGFLDRPFFVGIAVDPNDPNGACYEIYEDGKGDGENAIPPDEACTPSAGD